MKLASPFFALLALAAALAPAQTYLGAEAALRKVEESRGKSVASAGSMTPAIEAFRARSGSLSDAQAASEWLKLARAAAATASTNDYSMLGSPFNDVMGALPRPEAWPAIFSATHAGAPKTAVDASLRLMSSLLVNNPTAQFDDLVALQKLPVGDMGYMGGYLDAYVLTMAERTRDPKRIVTALNMITAKQTKGRPSVIPLPDLVTLLGAPAAREQIRKVMVLSFGEVTAPQGATLLLARQVAIENMAKLKTPKWSLATGTGGEALLKALQTRFKTVAPTNAQDQLDRFATLIVDGKKAAAVTMALNISPLSAKGPPEWLSRVQRAGKFPVLRDVLQQTLSKKPTAPWWPTYAMVASRLGNLDPVVTELRATLANPKVPANYKQALKPVLVEVLLGADKIDAGVKELRVLLAGGANGQNTRPEMGTTLARVGHLIGRRDLVEEGLKSLRAQPESNFEMLTVDLLLYLGRGPEAEAAAIASMSRPQIPGGFSGYGDSMRSVGLTRLMSVYHLVGRSQDVVMLLERGQGWPGSDLRDLLRETGYQQMPVLTMAAKALADLGRTQEALPIATAALAAFPAHDPTFQVFTDLKGQAAIPDLDNMFAVDRFEERPMIWKAVLQLKAGQVDQAGTTIRQAIAVDPSDGEQTYGHRMFAYTVLADVLKAKGDAEGEETYRNVVKAIRMSERADDFMAAHLTKRALALYEESLTIFADAYCIQSRLAIQLAQAGRMEEAESHYRKAFELMPSSFGRVESHCFGCEGAFEGELAQSIANSVLTKLTKEQSTKPQVPYLLGYLREAQGRTAEALAAYRLAVKMDPDYLNAWSSLISLGTKISLTDADRKGAEAAFIRLDPLGRHNTGMGQAGVDYRARWKAIEAALPKLLPIKDSLFPLAVRASLSPEEEMMKSAYGRDYSGYEGGYGSSFEWLPNGNRITSPSQALSQMGFMAVVTGIIASSSYVRR